MGKPPGPPQNKQERQDDFYANLGDAIRTLREDVPICLKSEISCALYLADFRHLQNLSLDTSTKLLVHGNRNAIKSEVKQLS